MTLFKNIQVCTHQIQSNTNFMVLWDQINGVKSINIVLFGI